MPPARWGGHTAGNWLFFVSPASADFHGSITGRDDVRGQGVEEYLPRLPETHKRQRPLQVDALIETIRSIGDDPKSRTGEVQPDHAHPIATAKRPNAACVRKCQLRLVEFSTAEPRYTRLAFFFLAGALTGSGDRVCVWE
jgi:hypothetical protein